MNSMQLTLLVSILRADSGSNFSIGDLLTLPVIRCLFCFVFLRIFLIVIDPVIQYQKHFNNVGLSFGKSAFGKHDVRFGQAIGTSLLQRAAQFVFIIFLEIWHVCIRLNEPHSVAAWCSLATIVWVFQSNFGNGNTTRYYIVIPISSHRGLTTALSSCTSFCLWPACWSRTCSPHYSFFRHFAWCCPV